MHTGVFVRACSPMCVRIVACARVRVVVDIRACGDVEIHENNFDESKNSINTNSISRLKHGTATRGTSYTI